MSAAEATLGKLLGRLRVARLDDLAGLLEDIATADSAGAASLYDIGGDGTVTPNPSFIGPEGPEGKEGPVGPEGPEGETGAAGKEGPPGAEGHEGPTGKEGKEGPAGPKGETGATGKEGPKGEPGPSELAESTPIRWLSGGSVQELIRGLLNGTTSTLELSANSSRKRAQGEASLGATSEGGQFGAIGISAANSLRSAFVSLLGVGVWTILDSEKKSSFLQNYSSGLAAASDRRINRGACSLEWAGGTSVSKALEVEHGLGVEPFVVAPTMLTQLGGVFRVTYGKTKFTIDCYFPDGFKPAAGFKAEARWIAMS